MKALIRSILVAVGLLTISTLSLAETAYVKDELFVPLRSGPSPQHRILHKGLKTSTVLTVLSRNEDKSWIQVQTPSGLEGWVPKQYVLSRPTASLQLAETSKKLDRLSKQHKEVLERLSETKKKLDKTDNNLRLATESQQNSTIELRRIKSISSGAIELDQKYQTLLEEHELLQTINDALHAENESLKSDQRFSFMFYGAILVILGALLAVIVPRARINKRHSEWAN